MAVTVAERDRLEARLHDGWHRLTQAEAAGADTTAWEAFWFKLLHEYQDMCRELDETHAISQPDAAPIGQMTVGGT